MFRVKEGIVSNAIEKANKNKQSLFAAGIFFIIANLFAVYFINQERFLYYWDFLAYWNKYTYLSEHFIGDTLSTIETVFWSIRENDYNHLAAFFLVPFGLLFGTSRLAYILSIVNIFALPAAISLVVLHRKLSEAQGYTSSFLFLIPIGVILLSPNFWDPILLGFVDVGGIFLTNLILLRYLKNSYSKQSMRDLLLIALLIPMPVLFRRWYAYWGVAFYFVLFIEICLTALLTRPFDIKESVKTLLKFLAQVSVSAVFFFTAAPTLARRILGSNYSDLYSAYRTSTNLFQSFEVVLRNFGLFYFALFVCGAVIATIDKKTRKFAIFLLAQWLVIFILFARTQDFDTHQLYLLLPPVLLFSSLFLTRLANAMKNFKILTISSVTLILFLNFLTAFTVKEFRNRWVPPQLLTYIRHTPLVRNDINELKRILAVLAKLLVDPQDRVYILASSDALNSNILDSAYLSFNSYKDVSKRIYKTHNIDKRDGFPQELLDAKYVMVGDPAQYHMNPKDQRVVGVPVKMFLEQTGIATSFLKLPYEFKLDKDVKIFIYKKIKPIRDSDAAYLSEMLRSYYPDRENVYKIPEKQ